MNLTNVNEITYICGFFISENSSFIKKKKNHKYCVLAMCLWISLTIYYCWEVDAGTPHKVFDSEKFESEIKENADTY